MVFFITGDKMKKKQRIRHDVAQANRNRSARAGGAYGGLSAQLNLVEHKYNLSSDGVGGTRAMGIFVSDGNYWEPYDLGDGTVLDGVLVGELTSATNAGP